MNDREAVVGDNEAHIKYNLRILDREIDLCHKLGVGLAFENIFDQFHLRRFGMRALELKQFIDYCNDPLIQACWDVGHGNLTMDEQAAGIRVLGDHIKALHIHDNNGKDDLHAMPFTGTVQWEKVMNALYESGCKADLVLETGFSGMPDALKDEGLKTSVSICRHLISLYQ